MNERSVLNRLLSARTFSYLNNRLSIAGAVITTISAIVLTVMLLASLGGALHNPYVAIVAYVILPTVFLLGLLLIPVGMWRQRRRMLAAGDELEMVRYPCLDFNDARLRRLGTVTALLTVVNAVILGAASYLAIESMDSVQFCGLTCHTVMQPEHTAYQQSPHSRVACVTCHIGPGASFFVRSKIDGLRQVWHTMLDTFPRPIQTPLETLRPARETCEQCHWPVKHFGDKIRIIAHVAEDEANTTTYNAMLLRTGGGSLDTGRHGGVHWWHINADNRIRYLASDHRRQEITWVELTTRDGTTQVYTRDGKPLPSEQQLQAEARIMDCIDCHNRPTHLFEPPAKALDRLLVDFPEYGQLPFFKHQALLAIGQEYPTHDAGVAGVREAMLAFYNESYRELAATEPALVEAAATAVAEIFARTTFPEMQTDWQTHNNNIGHPLDPDMWGETVAAGAIFPGCWRCHDDELATADGQTIPQDCDLCHVFLVEDSPTPPDLGSAVLK